MTKHSDLGVEERFFEQPVKISGNGVAALRLTVAMPDGSGGLSLFDPTAEQLCTTVRIGQSEEVIVLVFEPVLTSKRKKGP